MGVQVFPTSTGGGIKSVQRGSAASAGTVTITSVDTSKAFVNIFGTASAGSPALSGAVSAINASMNASNGSANAQSGANASATQTQGNNNPQLSTLLSGLTGGGSPNGWKLNGYSFNLSAQNLSMNSTTASFNTQNFSGGSTNLVTAVVQGYLSGATSLEVSGACRWEVIEFA